MSLRDQCAKEALNGILAGEVGKRVINSVPQGDWGLAVHTITHMAYELADAMLAEREKKPKERTNA